MGDAADVRMALAGSRDAAVGLLGDRQAAAFCAQMDGNVTVGGLPVKDFQVYWGDDGFRRLAQTIGMTTAK